MRHELFTFIVNIGVVNIVFSKNALQVQSSQPSQRRAVRLQADLVPPPNALGYSCAAAHLKQAQCLLDDMMLQ